MQTQNLFIEDISEVPQDLQGKSVYSCECGKKYLSFPALYLHAKTKHRVKFTSKPNSQVCSIKESDNLKDGKKQASSPGDRELRLLTTNQRSRSQRISNSLKPLGVFRGVFKHFYSDFPQKQTNKIFQTFEEYLEREFKEQRHKMNKTYAIWNIPNKLNSFVLESLEGDQGIIVGSQEWKQVCRQLYLLSEWLKKKKYTQLYVQCDVV